MTIYDSVYINLITATVICLYKNDNHQIYQCEYEVKSVNYDVRHAYGIWKWNNWYHFHSYFIYRLI